MSNCTYTNSLESLSKDTSTSVLLDDVNSVSNKPNDEKCMVKNDYQNSIIAGWVSPGSENSVRVFVAKKDIEAAKEAIKKARD